MLYRINGPRESIGDKQNTIMDKIMAENWFSLTNKYSKKS